MLGREMGEQFVQSSGRIKIIVAFVFRLPVLQTKSPIFGHVFGVLFVVDHLSSTSSIGLDCNDVIPTSFVPRPRYSHHTRFSFSCF